MTARDSVEFVDDRGVRTRNKVVLATLDGDPLAIGETTDALVLLSYIGSKLFDGSTFTVSYKTPSSIANDATLNFVLITGAEPIHFIGGAQCGGDAEVEILEDATITGGTSMPVYNRDRTSPQVSDVTVVRDATITDDGTKIFHKFVVGGSIGAGSIGASVVVQSVVEEDNDRFIFKGNSTYVVRVTNRAGSAQNMSLAIEWYV